MPLPSVIIVGAPNVGKSRLFNRLAGGRRSLVHATPGVTRDRLEARITLDRRTFLLVDTGGLVPGHRGALEKEIARQALTAAREADLLLFVVDLKNGLTALERDLAPKLRRLDRPVLLVLNKVDAISSAEGNRAEAWSLGLGEGVEISAEHAIGISELSEAIEQALPERPVPDAESDEAIPVAIVGRPNAGKSSLFNYLLGKQRAIVSEVPGTTHDRLEGFFEYSRQRYRLIDTAGLRRGARVHEPLEALTAAVARGVMDRSAITLVVLDAARGVDRQDLAVGGYALRTHRPLVVALNKVDLLSRRELEELRILAREEFGFARFAPQVPVSALTGRGLRVLKSTLRTVWVEGGRRVSTGALNRLIKQFSRRHSSSPRRRTIRPLYATQEGVHPPSFIVFGHATGRPYFAYRRALENFLRSQLELTHTPLVLRFRSRRG